MKTSVKLFDIEKGLWRASVSLAFGDLIALRRELPSVGDHHKAEFVQSLFDALPRHNKLRGKTLVECACDVAVDWPLHKLMTLPVSRGAFSETPVTACLIDCVADAAMGSWVVASRAVGECSGEPHGHRHSLGKVLGAGLGALWKKRRV